MAQQTAREAAREAAGSSLEPSPRPPFFADPGLICIALEAGQIGVWSWDISSGRATWSSNLEDICELARGRLDATKMILENDVHTDDWPSVTAALQEALRTRTPRRVQYRLQTKPGEDERWIETLAAVVTEGGVPVKLLGLCRDVTDRAKNHRELRIRAKQQEAVARLAAQALTELGLQRFFDDCVKTIADTLDVELVKILELVPGDAELLLRAGTGWKPGLVGTALVSTDRNSQAGYTLASGGPVIVDNLAAETRFGGQPLLSQHGAVSGLTIPIAGRDGRTYGVLGAHATRRRNFSENDVSFLAAIANVIAGAIQRRQLDQRHELMIRELRHRSGNLFAQLLALFSQTAKTSKNLAELVPKYEARVLALANAHRLITESGWRSASLSEILNPLLAPFLERVTLAGPDVFLEPDPTFGLSAAVHELATNASKYGSLSARAGLIKVSWSVQRTEQGLTLLFDWKERNGPPYKRIRRPGFGSKLIRTVIERQLNGKVLQTFGPKGMEVKLTIPLTHERWPGGAAPSSAEAPQPQIDSPAL
ncbi:MAG TPA: HWE histidine kinase domain-containing protein [Xanthobacteraceae bacterium]|nr:HWE histidine kinase domain-containing protein [Xanthobacteraceae bacterium]